MNPERKGRLCLPFLSGFTAVGGITRFDPTFPAVADSAHGNFPLCSGFPAHPRRPAGAATRDSAIPGPAVVGGMDEIRDRAGGMPLVIFIKK